MLASRRPDLVAGIVTLGSPTCDPLNVSRLTRTGVRLVAALGTLGAPGLFTRSCIVGDCCEEFWALHEAELPRGVGFVSIYSRSDGIVDWRSCLDPSAEHVEIRSSHVGMAVHPDGYRAIAAALESFRQRDRKGPGKGKRRPLRLAKAA